MGINKKDATNKGDTKSKKKDTTKEIILSRLTNNPISRGELKEILHISDRDIRKAIEELRIEGYPICSSARRRGYWIARDDEELRECISEYYSRSARLRLTANIMERNLGINKDQLRMEEIQCLDV